MLSLYQENWLKKCGEALSLPDLKFDLDNNCKIYLSNAEDDVEFELNITFLEDLDCLRFYIVLPLSNNEELTSKIERACQLNLPETPFVHPIYGLSDDKNHLLITLFFSRDIVINGGTDLLDLIGFSIDALTTDKRG